ncbi:MAG: tetratricopeptide repeat protein [Saprospiraceae bacterium]|nr:tetratricopeptide repeat protein [Saprospiraceae bacterium]
MTKGYRSRFQQSSKSNQSGSKADTLLDLGTVTRNAGTFFDKNRPKIFLVLGSLVAILGGYLAYKYLYQEPQNIEAAEQMYQAEFLFNKDSFDLALNNPGGGFAGFKEIAENYGGTKTGNIAKYYAGLCNLQLGNYEEAKTYFEDFEPNGKITPIIKYSSLGDVNANLNDYKAAIGYYEKASTINENDFLTPMVLKKLGVLKESQGDKEGALKAFEKIRDRYPGAPDANGIDRFIIRLQQ